MIFVVEDPPPGKAEQKPTYLVLEMCQRKVEKWKSGTELAIDITDARKLLL